MTFSLWAAMHGAHVPDSESDSVTVIRPQTIRVLTSLICSAALPRSQPLVLDSRGVNITCVAALLGRLQYYFRNVDHIPRRGPRAEPIVFVLVSISFMCQWFNSVTLTCFLSRTTTTPPVFLRAGTVRAEYLFIIIFYSVVTFPLLGFFRIPLCRRWEEAGRRQCPSAACPLRRR